MGEITTRLRIAVIALFVLGPWTTVGARPGPMISLSPASLSVTASEGGPIPASQTLVLSNSGGGHLDWTVSDDRPWLQVTPTSGHLNGGQSITLTVQITATPQTERWTPISNVNAPSAREDHDAVWTGSRMVMWGGELNGGLFNTGGIYDPVTDTWTGETSLLNAPSPRTLHTMVWTGQQAIVWGGSTGASSGDTYYNQGYRYNPATDQWQGAIATAGAPSARSFHTAVWTGSKMIVWGGYDGTQLLNTGGIYDLSKNKWMGSTSTVGAPSARLHHAAVWTGTEMIVWGGQDASVNLNDGARYDPATNTWTPMSTVNAPLPRQAPVAAWTGWEMLIWGGGVDVGGSTDTGARYNPSTDTWAAETTRENALSPRQGHVAAWTGSGLIITHGAFAGGPFFDNGAVYTPPVLPRGTHTATVKVTAMGGMQKTAPVTLTVGPPIVPNLNVTASTPSPGASLPGASDSIFLTLDESLEASSVNSGSVKLFRKGPDGVFGTPDDIALNPAISVVGTNQIRVSLAGIPVTTQDVRLRVSGTPAGLAGRFGHWRLDEGSGTSTADASGNGRVGLLDNVTWAQGRVGTGLHFDGGANRVVIDAGAIPPSWTAALWVRREDSPNVDARLMDCKDTDTFGTSLRLEQFNLPDRMGFTTYAIEDYFFDYIMPTLAWTHVAFVGTAGGTSLYIDGVLIGTHPASVSLFVDKLGSHGFNAMKGTMDEVQVYSRALTAAEILSLAQLAGSVRSTSGRVVDGEFSGIFPSGNGVSGGDFVATYKR